MELEEIIARMNATAPRKKPSDEEHKTQVACVRWYRYKWHAYWHNLFAVPNGGRRDKVTGAKLRDEGVLAGVSDLVLLRPNARYHGLCIEMKTRTGRQADTQREWQRLIERDGYKYVVCRSLDDFMREVDAYLEDI